MVKRGKKIKQLLPVILSVAIFFSSANITDMTANAESVSSDCVEDIIETEIANENVVSVETDILTESEILTETEALTETGLPTETEVSTETGLPTETEVSTETGLTAETEASTETGLTAETEASNEAGLPIETEASTETEISTEDKILTESESLIESSIEIKLSEDLSDTELLEDELCDTEVTAIAEHSNIVISEHQGQVIKGEEIVLTYQADSDNFVFGNEYVLKINGSETDITQVKTDSENQTITFPADMNNKAGVLRIEFAKENCTFTPVYQQVYEDRSKDKWNLIWQDEFSGTKLDSNKWDYQVGTGGNYGTAGWGNNEKQYYTQSEENLQVENGKLTITARKDTSLGYTSARIRTVSKDEGRMLNGVPQTGTAYQAAAYGKIEAKMKLPKGQGLWPALWLLPYNSKYGRWASGGEIDIMEARGRLPQEVSGAVHYGSVWPNNVNFSKKYHFTDSDITDYHIYTLEWDPTEIRWMVDGEVYASCSNWYSISSDGSSYPYPAPFDERFYILFNLAVGGNFDQAATEIEIDDDGASMDVDYVRWYQRDAEVYNNWLIKEPEVEKDTSEEAQELIKHTYVLGNYINDVNFEAMDTNPYVINSSWEIKGGYWVPLLIPGNGNGDAAWSKIRNGDKNYLKVCVNEKGSQIYSSQMLQYLPLIKGYKYELTYTAYTDADNTKTDISIQFGGDEGESWAKYSPNYQSKLTTIPKTYTHQFTMSNETDATARLEINLATSEGNVYISDVCVKLVDDEMQGDEEKTEDEAVELILDVKLAGEPSEIVYTGKAVKPRVEVYNGNDKLTEKKDYTIKYKNNINAGKNAIITVKGKGNYQGEASISFEILPMNLSELEMPQVYSKVSEGSEPVIPKIVIKNGKKKLIEQTEYKLEMPNVMNDEGDVIPGHYEIIVRGIEGSNYTGENVISYDIITDSTLLMSKAKIKVIDKKVEYKGSETKLPRVEVKIGKEILTEDKYEVVCENIKIGKAQLKIVGKNGVYGIKTAAFNITGTRLGKKIRVEGIGTKVYTGDRIIFDELAVYDTSIKNEDGSEKRLMEDIDYTIKYEKNVDAGKGKVIIRGIGNYTGKLTKTFSIDKADLSDYQSNSMIVWACEATATYKATGAAPKFTLMYNGKALKISKDYTVSYKKNKAVSAQTATITIKGKGNFKGKITDTFEVTYPSADSLYAVASDMYMPNNVSGLEKEVNVKVFDSVTKKTLKAGRDYEKTVECYLIDEKGNERKPEQSDLINDKIFNVRITLKNNYRGSEQAPQTVNTTFRIYSKRLSTDIRVSPIVNRVYTGKKIEPRPAITDKYGVPLIEKLHYTVSYENNQNVGKAKMIITGIGDGYGGTKIVYFNIIKAPMKFSNIIEKLKSSLYNSSAMHSYQSVTHGVSNENFNVE